MFFVFLDPYILCIYVMNILSTFHISVSWVWYIYNSIKDQSFVYTQLNYQTVLFQTIQFNINHLFELSINVKVNSLNTGWNDKIVVLKKTTLQLYFKTFIEKINSGNLIM